MFLSGFMCSGLRVRPPDSHFFQSAVLAHLPLRNDGCEDACRNEPADDCAAFVKAALEANGGGARQKKVRCDNVTDDSSDVAKIADCKHIVKSIKRQHMHCGSDQSGSVDYTNALNRQRHWPS
jgi:hypothetical protein